MVDLRLLLSSGCRMEIIFKVSRQLPDKLEDSTFLHFNFSTSFVSTYIEFRQRVGISLLFLDHVRILSLEFIQMKSVRIKCVEDCIEFSSVEMNNDKVV